MTTSEPEPCNGWLDEPYGPLRGGPCGEPTVCVIRSGCAHEHIIERRACSGCAIDEQQAAAYAECGRCSMTGPMPHVCYPTIVIVWDEGYRDPEPVTIAQQGDAEYQAIEIFGRGELIATGRGEDLYVHWSHITESPKWIGTRAEAITAGCEEGRLRRADETGSSYFRSEPGLFWKRHSLTADQRGSISRDRLAAYTRAYADDRLTDAYLLLEPFEDAV